MTLDTNCVKESDSLLLVWGKDTNPQQLQADISPIKDKCSHVHLENAERLLMGEWCDFCLKRRRFVISFSSAGLAQSSFDVVACGYLGDMSVTLSADCFAEVAKVLKPGGRLMLREACVKETSNGLRTCAQLSSALKLAGFIDVSKVFGSLMRDCIRRRCGLQFHEEFQIKSFTNSLLLCLIKILFLFTAGFSRYN